MAAGAGSRVASEPLADGKALEIRQARIAGAEIVHRNPRPRVPQVAQRARRTFRIAHEQRFGELELDQRRIDAGFPQNASHDGLEVLLLELARGDVYRTGLTASPA